jgi:hypothetical protein
MAIRSRQWHGRLYRRQKVNKYSMFQEISTSDAPKHDDPWKPGTAPAGPKITA